MLRRLTCSSGASCLRSSSFVTLRAPHRSFTAASLSASAPLFLLHRRMRDYGESHHTITAQGFDTMARECGVADAAEAKRGLSEAGYVVDFGDYVHLRPALLIQQTSGWSVADGERGRLSVLVAEEREEAKALEGPMRRLYKRQRFVWACALVFCGLQGCVIANLTFTEDGPGWDVMEPVSYFIGCYTSLAFFVYMLRYRREHSYAEFDKTVIVPALRSKYAANFNWKKYDALCASIRSQDARVSQMTQWMRKN